MAKNECTCTILHKEKVDDVKASLDGADFSDILTLSKCINDPSRIKILYALKACDEMCVCDLSAVLESSNALASHHLRFLKKHGLVASRKEGKTVYYSLLNQSVLDVLDAFQTMKEIPVYQ